MHEAELSRKDPSKGLVLFGLLLFKKKKID